MSGSLIPNAKQQFLDANGNPLAGGFVYYYIPSTTTFKNTYQNAALTILNSNPIVLDSAGECIAYGVGSFRQIVTDVNGNLIWDQPTLGLFSNDAASVIYTPPFTNSVPETVSAKLSQTISVKDFGAVGDGTTDDTNAIKNAIVSATSLGASILIPMGTYLVTDTLNVTASMIFNSGRISINHTLKLNGNASLTATQNGGINFLPGVDSNFIGWTPNHYKVQLLCGLDSTWTGKISGLVFEFPNTQTAIYGIIIYGGNGFEVSNNTFNDLYGSGGMIIGPVSTSYALSGSAPYTQLNGKILNNSIFCRTGNIGFEIFGTTATCDNWLFDGNTGINFGDDCIGMYESSNITFTNNYFKGQHPVIRTNSCTNVIITNNTVIKINNAPDAQGGIAVAPYSTSYSYSIKNGVIANNMIINNDTVFGMSQPILVNGSTNLSVLGNTLINNTSTTNFTLLTSVSVTPSVEQINLLVKDNVVIGGIMYIQNSGSSASSGQIVVNNFADAKGLTTYPIKIQALNITQNNYCAGNIGVGSTTPVTNTTNEGTAFDTRTLFGIFTAPTVTGTATFSLVGGSTYLYFAQDTRLDQLNIQFSGATPVQCIIAMYKYDGSTTTSLGDFTIAAGVVAKSYTTFDATGSLSHFVIPAGSAIKFDITPSGSLGSTTVSINLFATKFVFH